MMDYIDIMRMVNEDDDSLKEAVMYAAEKQVWIENLENTPENQYAKIEEFLGEAKDIQELFGLLFVWRANQEKCELFGRQDGRDFL